jgi:nucleoid-associated protein YgaU
MRTDMKLGLAVGSILFGVVLVYVVFVAGGGNIVDPSPKNQAAPVASTGAAPTGEQPQTPSTQTPAATVANPPNTPGGSPAPTVTITAPLPTEQTAGNSPLAPTAQRGGWSWGDALSHGAGTDLISHTLTPTAPTTRPSSVIVDVSRTGASGASTPATPAATSGGRTYVVQPGESFWSIAKTVYGSAAYYPHLTRANPTINPARLKTGMKINLPDKDAVVTASASAVLLATTPTTRPVDPGTHYQVRAGDSLQGISKKLYGKADRWDKLYQLNKGAIGSNPSVLKQNMVLQLPEPPSGVMPMAGPIQ